MVVDDVVQHDEHATAEYAADRQPGEMPLGERRTDQIDRQCREERTCAKGHENADRAVIGTPEQGRERSEWQRARAQNTHR